MKKTLSLLSILLILFQLSSCVTTNNNQISNEEYLLDSKEVTVTHTEKYYSFEPQEYQIGVIFFPKQNVDIKAYAPLLHELAKEGFLTILLNINSITINNNIEEILSKYNNLDWCIGGHASGGIMASNYLKDNHYKFQGLFLLSAFSNINLSDTDLKIASIYGEKDNLLDMTKYQHNFSNLGNNCQEYIIKGGNHSYFGNYGIEDGDGKASITRETQMQITINHIKELLTKVIQDANNSQPREPQSFKIKYTESIETFANPDRGFYEPAYIYTDQNQVGSVKKELLFSNSLIHLRIDLSMFSSKYNGSKDFLLTDKMLDSLDALFSTINQSGACVIVRFAYDNQYAGNVDMEPKLNVILKHIEQFSPIINKYKKMITAVECGLVGPWGEMHSSKIATQETYNQIFTKYLTHLEPDVTLLVRRPEFIYKFYGLNLKTLGAFNYENNRIGCFNDGYLGSSTDLGTFENRELEIAFLEKVNTNKPYGGEVTVPDSAYNRLSWACQEMFKTNLTYLNLHWNDQVIQRWQETKYNLNDPLYANETEFTYINNHLGYRLVCQELECSIDKTLDIKLSLKNVGFGEIFKEKQGYIILKSKTKQYVYKFAYNNELLISESFDIQNIKFGNYSLYLVLADSFDQYATRGIRFANKDMYDENLQANKLLEFKI